MHQLLETAKEVIKAEMVGLNALQGSIDQSFLDIVNAVSCASGKVILSGIGKSGYVARKIAATLSSTGTPAIFLHPAEASHGDLGVITNQDIAILLSNSGEAQELNPVICYCKRIGVTIIGITRRKNSYLYKVSDIKALLPDSPEAGSTKAPTTSTTMMMVFGDALAVTLLNHKGFTKEDFALLHPGGNIGAQLLKVRNLMHKRPELPFIHENELGHNMLIEITQKRMGCVGVLNDHGKLVGIVTDGDLRRHLQFNLQSVAVRDLMTIDPYTIEPDMLAMQALSIMNAHLITVLFVLEDDLPVGLVHIHDLIKAGVS